MGDGTGSQTYAYDDDDDLTQKVVTWTGVSAKTVSYTFNPDSSRSGMTADTHPFTYAYDGVGRMTGLTNYNSETTHWAYQANGWLLSKTLANGVVTTYTRDPQGRLTDQASKYSTSTLSDFAVPATGGYDGVGNRLSVTSTVSGAPAGYTGTSAYQYDYGTAATAPARRSQLTAEAGQRGTFSYGYDGSTTGGPGNPTSFKSTANTFNSDNQVTNTGYSYDGAGNPTTYSSATLAFDPENRLSSDSVGSQTDGYSGDGLRAWKQTGASTTRIYYLYDGDAPVIQERFDGGFVAANTWGVDGLVSRRENNLASTFYLYDERGNVSERLDINRSVRSTDSYDAYGTRTGTVSQPDPWGYEAQAGYYTDTETGLILCTHRYYDPGTGRFLSRDPMGYGGGVNLYGYVGNDPSNRADPSGYQGTWSGPGNHDGTTAEPTNEGGDGQMPGKDDPTGSEGGGYGHGTGYLGGPIPVGGGGMLPGGINGESHASCPPIDYPPEGYVLNWIFTTINNGITSVETSIDGWSDQNFGPGSDFSNGWNHTFNSGPFLPR